MTACKALIRQIGNESRRFLRKCELRKRNNLNSNKYGVKVILGSDGEQEPEEDDDDEDEQNAISAKLATLEIVDQEAEDEEDGTHIDEDDEDDDMNEDGDDNVEANWTITFNDFLWQKILYFNLSNIWSTAILDKY